MQQGALIAFKTQTLLAALTHTLPSSVPADSVNVEELRAKLTSGMAAATSLQAALKSKNILYPITGKDDPLVTIFLLDIDGTIAPLPYSTNVMLPAILSHMRAYIDAHYPGKSELAAVLKGASGRSMELKEALQADAAASSSVPASVARVRTLLYDHLKEVMESQSSMPYVKQFQGDIWADVMHRQGAKARTRVFRDFVDFVKLRGARAARQHTKVFIYSTGSVKSQETVLTHTQEGDLNPFVSGLIDTAMVGSKLVPSSYSKICAHISAVTGMQKGRFRIIFCTDNPSEACAADTSGDVSVSILVVRPGNAWINIDTLLAVSAPHISSFSQLMDSVRPVDYDALVAEMADLLKPSEATP